MQSIEIKNLRSLKDTGRVELKPITLLVGANSSGKSTFLRTFPLLKQGLKVIGFSSTLPVSFKLRRFLISIDCIYYDLYILS